MLTLCGVAAFMVWGAGHYTVFDDEAFSCQRYVMPMGEMVSALWHGEEPDPPLYYVLENGWVRVFGVGPLGLRSLSILFFLGELVFIRLAGQAWFDAKTGLVAMLLCALHPAHLFFGFAARWYSLMFLWVAVLLWVSERMGSTRRRRREWTLAWGVIAAAVCHTNYFGPVVVGLVWLVGVLRGGGEPHAWRRWVWAGLIVLVFYAVWIPPLLEQTVKFHEASLSWQALGGTAARTVLALLAGNLASVGAWWVWVPMGAFGIGLMVLLVLNWRAVWSMGVVALGCLAVGVLSRTMIDKYVMTFSGVACLLAAALLVRGIRAGLPRASRITARLTVACLVIGWVGCGVNLVTQRHWSSLRWLDPFERVAALSASDEGPAKTVVTSHPSARYYFAKMFVDARNEDPPEGSTPRRTDVSDWRSAMVAQSGSRTPGAILPFLGGPDAPRVIQTVQTAGFVSLPEWESLQAVLDERYAQTDERKFLEDPDAEWKDRVDPNVKHPRWRIVVRTWELRR